MSWLSEATAGSELEDKVAKKDPAAAEASGIVDSVRTYAGWLDERGIDLAALASADPETQKAWWNDAQTFGSTMMSTSSALAGVPWVGEAFDFVDSGLKSLFGEAHGKVPPPPPKPDCKDAKVYEEYAELQRAMGRPVDGREMFYGKWVTGLVNDMMSGKGSVFHSWKGTDGCKGLLARLTDPSDIGSDPVLAQQMMMAAEDATGGRFLDLELLGPGFKLQDTLITDWPRWLPIGQPNPLSDIFVQLYGVEGFTEESDYAALAILPASFGLPESSLAAMTEAERERYFGNLLIGAAVNNAGSPDVFWETYKDLMERRKSLYLDGQRPGVPSRRGGVDPGLLKASVERGIKAATTELGRNKDELRAFFLEHQKALASTKEGGDGSIPGWVPVAAGATGLALGMLWWLRRRKKRKR
jgi:hypothetical protein